jgi:hypothetical protein
LRVWLSEFPGNTWHVVCFPCKYFLALTEELDERVVLCDSEICRHIECFLRVRGMHLLFLCFLCNVEFVGFYIPIIGRRLCVICDNFECIELFLNSKL